MVKILPFLSSGFHVFLLLFLIVIVLYVLIAVGKWFLVLFLAQFIIMNE